jgi:thiopurine S-methyltransferase
VEKAFWQSRWDQNQIGFHEAKPNDLLTAHHARIANEKRVLVPLAGKAVDLWWLAERGHEVVGIEFVRLAIEQFFDERALIPEKHALGKHEAFSAGGVTLVHADMFEVEGIGPFDAIYDRAALVALDPKDRVRYVQTCRSLVRGPTFLVAFSYDQSRAPGPPWSIDDRTVRALYANRSIEILGTQKASISPRLREAGVDAMDETAYLIGH